MNKITRKLLTDGVVITTSLQGLTAWKIQAGYHATDLIAIDISQVQAFLDRELPEVISIHCGKEECYIGILTPDDNADYYFNGSTWEENKTSATPSPSSSRPLFTHPHEYKNNSGGNNS